MPPVFWFSISVSSKGSGYQCFVHRYHAQLYGSSFEVWSGLSSTDSLFRLSRWTGNQVWKTIFFEVEEKSDPHHG